MSENAETENGRAISRLADSGEQAVRELAALPLRMLAGTLGVFEAALRTTADRLREIDPQGERLVELEKRLDSLEKQTTGRRESARLASTARRKRPSAAPEDIASDEPASGSGTAAPSGGA